MPEIRNVTVDLDRTGSSRAGTDIDYANRGVTLDVSYFSDRDTNPRPVIIGVHGGAFSVGDKDSFDEGIDDAGSPYLKPEYFTSLGYPYVSVNYRLADNQNLLNNISGGTVDVNNLDFTDSEWTSRLRLDDLISDVVAAISWVFTNASQWGFDATQIILVGHSAGNHLIGGIGSRRGLLFTAGLDVSFIKGVILIDSERYDVTNILAGYTDTSNQGDWAFMNVYGVNPDINNVDFTTLSNAQAYWSTVSIIDNLNRNVAATEFAESWCIVARGLPDRIAESAQISEALTAKGIQHTFLEYPGTMSDGITTYSHSGIHKVLGGVDIPNTNPGLQAIGRLNLSTELGIYINNVFNNSQIQQCTVDSDCPDGFVCLNGVCVADDTAPPLPPDRGVKFLRSSKVKQPKHNPGGNGQTWQEAVRQSVSTIPYDIKRADDVGLFGDENYFLRVDLNVTQTSVFRDPNNLIDGYYNAYIDDVAPELDTFYTTAAVLDDIPEEDPDYLSAAILYDNELPSIGSNPYISIDLTTIKSGNIYLDSWLDTRIYDKYRQEWPYTKAYVRLNDMFYLGVHARNTKRLPYNFNIAVGEQYLTYEQIPDKRYIMS